MFDIEWGEMRKQQVPIKRNPSSTEECGEGRAPKGFVPVLVGVGEELKRFLVSVELFKHPCFVGLLEMAAQEFGYQPKGVLRIPCDPEHFQQVFKLPIKDKKQVFKMISKSV